MSKGIPARSLLSRACILFRASSLSTLACARNSHMLVDVIGNGGERYEVKTECYLRKFLLQS